MLSRTNRPTTSPLWHFLAHLAAWLIPLSVASAQETDATTPPQGGAFAEPTEDAWDDLQPDVSRDAVKRTTDSFPLSDQENDADWEKYAPMWDEFEGAALDPVKWWDCNPEWKGRQPGFFHPGNVEVRDGKLHLTMRKEEVPEMPKDAGFHTYTCAAVQSKGKVRYGYFEVKAKPMASAGSSSFWFYKNTREWWTEIDVYEIGGESPS